MNIKPLHSGSKIAIVAPAGRIFQSELNFALDWIQKNDWEAVYTPELFTEYNLGYFYAGNNTHRLQQLQFALDNSEIDAIWFARGGYGSVHLIDDVDLTAFMQNPKWLIGYSDITVFHNHLNNLGIPTLHAVTAKQLNVSYSQETYSSLQKALSGQKLDYEIPHHPKNIEGKATGKLVGGNLSIIYSLLASNSFISGENLILFIEDWQENWYHLDRMMMALKRSGLFQKVKGLVVGSFTKMDTREGNLDYDSEFDEVSYQIIRSYFEESKIPVLFQFPAGHIGENRAMVLGVEVLLEVNSNYGKLEWV